LLVALSSAVALLPPVRLSILLHALVLLQFFALVGISGARDSGHIGSGAVSFFSYLNIVNFDLEVTQPGCGDVPPLTHVRMLQYTMLLMLATGMLFVLACAVRLAQRLVKASRAPAAAAGAPVRKSSSAFAESAAASQSGGQSASSVRAPRSPKLSSELKAAAHLEFRHRAKQSVLVVLLLFYLRMTVLLLSTYLCTSIPDPLTDPNADPTYSSVLTADGQTMCYVGDHLPLVVGASVLLLFYIALLPLFLKAVLQRAAVQRTVDLSNEPAHVQPIEGRVAVQLRGAQISLAALKIAALRRREDMLGVLYLHLRAANRLYVGLLVCACAVLASVFHVFVAANALRLCLFGVLCSLAIVAVALRLPYRTLADNVRFLVELMCILLLTVTLLALQDEGTDDVWFFLLVPLVAIVAFVLLFREQMARWFPKIAVALGSVSASAYACDSDGSQVSKKAKKTSPSAFEVSSEAAEHDEDDDGGSNASTSGSVDSDSEGHVVIRAPTHLGLLSLPGMTSSAPVLPADLSASGAISGGATEPAGTLHGWLVFDELTDPPLQTGDELRTVELLDAQGKSFAPARFQKQVKRAAHSWQLYDELTSPPLQPGDEVKEVELFDEQGQSYDPQRFKKHVRRNPQNHGWILIDDAAVHNGAGKEGTAAAGSAASAVNAPAAAAAATDDDQEVLFLEEMDKDGKPHNPPLFKRFVRKKLKPAAKPTPRVMEADHASPSISRSGSGSSSSVDRFSGMRRPVITHNPKPALRSALLQSAAVQRLARWNKLQATPKAGAVQQAGPSSPPSVNEQRGHGAVLTPVRDHATPPRVNHEAPSAATTGALGSPFSRRTDSLSAHGTPTAGAWGSPSHHGLASPTAVMLRMGSTTGGMGSPNASRPSVRFGSMDEERFALPGPVLGSNATAASMSPAPSPTAAAAVIRGSRLDRMSSRGSLSLVSPGSPVIAAAASDVSPLPPRASMHRRDASVSASASSSANSDSRRARHAGDNATGH
jgi:hypothetical protein